MTGFSFHAHKTMSHFWGPENLTLEHEASRCIVKCCKQYALTASAAQIPTTRSSDCAFPATVCGWQRPPSGRQRCCAIWYLPYISVGKQTNEGWISPSLRGHVLSIKPATTCCAVLVRSWTNPVNTTNAPTWVNDIWKSSPKPQEES